MVDGTARPLYVENVLARADECYNRGDMRGRLKYFERVAREVPSHPLVKAWIGECRLALGDWSPESWALWEHRWFGEPWAGYYRQVHAEIPRWTGEQDLSGKTLFVLLDGGYGDVFQNYRYVRWLEQGGARVVFQVRPEQAGLCPGVSGEGQEIQGIDYFVNTCSLPGAFGSQPETIPLPYRPPGYTVHGRWPPERVAAVWSSSSQHRENRHRFPLPLPAVSWPPVRWVTLPERGDWRETAKLLQTCDLLITVDTAVAHLAGCLGLPVWCLMSVRSGWQWLRDTPTTGWYPTMRIFRQRTLDDWTELLERVAGTLAAALDGEPAIA